MHRSFLPAVALIATLGLVAAPHVQAQSANPNIPIPGQSTIFPVNQPVTFRYTDTQGAGSITFVDLGLDQVTGFDLLQVTIAQNGLTYNGSGIATVIPGAAQPLTDLVSFTVVSPSGVAYFFEGKMGLGVEFQGSGTYHPVSAPNQLASWGLLFAPGTPPPGPQPTALSLSLDRGCGSVYPLGGPMIITFSAASNDTLTLMDQRNDGTLTLFANQAVVGGQTYSISTFVSMVPGPRTLILTDPAGGQAVCTFSGQ
jgi:hypothetical protein